MAEQLTLLGDVIEFRRGWDHETAGWTLTARVETPAARATDPDTSHQAAAEITGSGERESQQRAVVDLVRRHPGSTAGELARIGHGGLPADAARRYYAIQRRVSEMSPQHIRRGDQRKCSVSGRMATELWPAERRHD